VIDAIRQKSVLGEFELSEHAFQQSIVRKIRIHEMAEVIATAEIIESYPNDKYGPSFLLMGSTLAGRPLHLQVSTPVRPLLKIITAYQPDPTLWIDFRRRRTTDTP